MREQLKNYNDGNWHTFSGIYAKKGQKKDPITKKTVNTVLLTEIRDRHGKYMTSHMWFNYEGDFKKLNLKNGNEVQFDAKVTEYVKGYWGQLKHKKARIEVDYSLEFPNKVKILSKS